MSLSIETISTEMFASLAQNFPITCASDEFYYFPQVQTDLPDWSLWDRFTPHNIAAFGRRLSHWETSLIQSDIAAENQATRIDRAILCHLACTLREQLAEVKTWRTQPSFYLIIANIGLAEALGSENPDAIHQRAATLPAFLDQARKNLERIPELFRDIGLTMIKDTQAYFALLIQIAPELKASLEALERFETTLQKVPTIPGFRLRRDFVEKIYHSHLGMGMNLEAIMQELDLEIETMTCFLEKEAARIDKASSEPRPWRQIVADMPLPKIGEGGLLELYRDVVKRLTRHCLDEELISSELMAAYPVIVAPVPSYLAAIRTASSYSISPSHPPTGGTFYIINADDPDEAMQGYQKEHLILSAHETYPGHHLLDISRWRLKRPICRVTERPLFYEGWACFAEELMRLTGFLKRPEEHLLMARRRLWRAIRGKIDLGLQTGVLDSDNAALLLHRTGVSLEQAKEAVRKYPLNPGYQVCYTIGLRRFLNLFKHYGQKSTASFVCSVLAQGEIDFSDLENVLQPEKKQ